MVPKQHGPPAELGEQTLPPAQDKGQLLSPACTGLFALLPINRATLSGRQGPEGDQSLLARRGH